MSPQRSLLLAALTTLFASPTVFAQEQQGAARTAALAAPTVAVATAGGGVRFTAVGPVGQMRVEVFDASGDSVYGSGFTRGGVRDWDARGAQGQTLPDGQYLCVVTVRDLAGRVSVKQGSILLQKGEALLLKLSESEQAASLASGGAEDALAYADVTSPAAVTVATHDGRDGAVTATSGDLTLRTGDVFSGKDKEQMRLTPEGRVGIGTDKPEATLDVAGEVRAREGFRFSDGSRLTISDAGALVRLSPDGTPLPGWGTPSGSQAGAALADTVVDGDLVFTNPGFPNYGRDIRLSDNLGGMRIFGAPSLTASPAGAAIQFFGNGHTQFPGQAYVDAGAHNNAAVIFRSAPTGGTIAERMRVSAAGDVGIGINAPQARLHVAGTVNFTGLRTFDNATSPNVIGGHSNNAVTTGMVGATIGGGGNAAFWNRVTDNYGTVGGGTGNRAGDNDNTLETANFATVGGGLGNIASGEGSTVGGGQGNTAIGAYSSVGGGSGNLAIGAYSFVGGGIVNNASGERSTVGGGYDNTASGQYSTVPGGVFNSATGDYSFAAGRRAQALDHGSFVWSDSTTAPPSVFSSTGENQFLIKATGNVGINTNAPATPLHVRKDAQGAIVALLTLMNGGGFNNAGAALDFMTFDFSNAQPSARILATDHAGFAASLSFWTKPSGTASTATLERMRIDQVGNVGIGTTTPARKLHVSDAMRLQPIASPPASPASGDLYFDSSEALCVYVGGAWAKLAGAGTCQ